MSQENQDAVTEVVAQVSGVVQSDESGADELEQLVNNRKPAHRQTGPKTQRGKWHSKWNALKHGRYAKST